MSNLSFSDLSVSQRRERIAAVLAVGLQRVLDQRVRISDPLEYLLPIIESQQMTIGNDEVSRWPAGVLQTLTALGILVPAEEAGSIRCPECGEHWEEIIAGDGPGGSAQFFIRCPEVLRIEVTQQHRRQWRPNLSALVHLLASSLDLAGKPQELMTGRLWRLGRMTWNSESRDVLFVRGLQWPDGDQPRAHVVRQRKPILVSSTYLMPSEFWRTLPPQIVLRDIAWFTDRLTGDKCAVNVQNDGLTAPPMLSIRCKV